jgi:glycerophosphoryl diester phosphodiesterase
MAHRGGSRHPDVAGFENTRRAFASAVGLGYRYLETDVHATSDGQLLAFHDVRLDRLTDLTGRVTETTYADVAAARIGGCEPVPRLADLLEAFPSARFNVDLKSPGAVDPLVALVERLGAHDRLCVASFEERVLRRFRARVRALSSRPVATGCGVLTVVATRWGGRAGGRLEVLQRLLRDPGAAYQVPVTHRGLRIVDRSFVDRAHALGRQVHVWTVDDRAEMARLLDLGVDGLITDRTDVLKEVLVERGQWWGSEVGA